MQTCAAAEAVPLASATSLTSREGAAGPPRKTARTESPVPSAAHSANHRVEKTHPARVRATLPLATTATLQDRSRQEGKG